MNLKERFFSMLEDIGFPINGNEFYLVMKGEGQVPPPVKMRFNKEKGLFEEWIKPDFCPTEDWYHASWFYDYVFNNHGKYEIYI